jgi:hypothetical protein
MKAPSPRDHELTTKITLFLITDRLNGKYQ